MLIQRNVTMLMNSMVIISGLKTEQRRRATRVITHRISANDLSMDFGRGRCAEMTIPWNVLASCAPIGHFNILSSPASLRRHQPSK